MYGHFPHDGLTRGRIRDRIIKKNMECQFHIEQKLQSRRKCIPANISGCLDTIFCQDRPAWIERSAWILISWSARKGCESVCPDRCFCLDARIDLPGYCQDTIHQLIIRQMRNGHIYIYIYICIYCLLACDAWPTSI